MIKFKSNFKMRIEWILKRSDTSKKKLISIYQIQGDQALSKSLHQKSVQRVQMTKKKSPKLNIFLHKAQTTKMKTLEFRSFLGYNCKLQKII